MNAYVGKERISDTHYSITFDLQKFVEVQKQIATKYESEEDFICMNKGCKDFINRFDRYILHCLEEIIEAREEIRKKTTSQESLMELIDILMYLGTMNSIITTNLDYFHMQTQSILNIDYLVTTKTPNQIDNVLMDISELLVETRRMLPQRKWHKPSNDFPELQVKYIMNDIYHKNIDAIKLVLELILSCAKLRQNDISEAINTKQQFILNLPIPQ